MYGFSGITDVNDGFLSMSLQRGGEARFYNELAEIQVSDTDIVVISYSDGDVAQLEKKGGNIVLFSPNASRVNYLVFNTNTAKTEGYGVEVYNSRGQVVFSSNHKFLRPTKLVDTNLNRGFFSENSPYGKKYGVIVSNYGFRIDISPEHCRKVMRSVKVDNSQVIFNSVNHDNRGAGRIPVTFTDNTFFANAIIVDITGY